MIKTKIFYHKKEKNLFLSLKRKKGSYTKSPDPLFKIPGNIEKLLKTNVVDISNSQDKANLHKFFNKNLKRWLGTSMNMEAFEVFIEDVGRTTKNIGKTAENIGKTTEEVIKEVEAFIKDVLNSEPVEVETGRELISKHLSTPI